LRRFSCKINKILANRQILIKITPKISLSLADFLFERTGKLPKLLILQKEPAGAAIQHGEGEKVLCGAGLITQLPLRHTKAGSIRSGSLEKKE